MQGLQDKVVVITGASSGIGRATAHLLAGQGARLVLAARGEASLTETARECEEHGAKVLTVATDTTDRQAVEMLKTRALEVFGHIDVWINGAAVTAFGKFDQAPEEVFRQVVETDFFGYVNCARAVLPHFKERRRGTLINIASIVADTPQPYTSAYVASKAAVRALGESLRMELQLDRESEIHICTVMPTTVDTPLYQHSANYSGRSAKALGPVYTPERVAMTIARLIRHPRREVIVGGSGRMMALERRVAPRLFDRVYAWFVDRDHLGTKAAAPTEGNVFRAMPELDGIRGGWRVPTARRRKGILIGLAATAGVAALAGAAWFLKEKRKVMRVGA